MRIEIVDTIVTYHWSQESVMAIEYKLCAAATATELNKQVNELLEDEWALYGNPFFSPLNGSTSGTTSSGGLICQALTKVPKKVAGVR